VDQGRGLAPDPPGRPGRARLPGPDRLVPRHRGRRLRPRQKRGALTGPSPVDRGKPGSKIHVLSDRGGLPLSVAASAANVNDALALKALVRAIPAIRSRRGPRRRRPAKLHADKAYDQADLRRWLRDRGIAARIARKGVESSEKLGRHRWVIERTIAWLTGYRRLTLRYERNASHFLAFITLAATLTCYKKLTKLTT
jgi:transposase